MLKRNVALAFLQNVLWSMLDATETLNGHTREQCRGIILDIEPLLNTSKIQAIKDLREWANIAHKITLPSKLGMAIRGAMMAQGNLYPGADTLLFQNDNQLGLKDAKDFIDVMEVVLKNTEAKKF